MRMPDTSQPLTQVSTALERGRPAVLIGTTVVLCAHLFAHPLGVHVPRRGLSAVNRAIAGYYLADLGVALLRHGSEGFIAERAADAVAYLPHAALVALSALGLAALPVWATWAESACGAACIYRELVALDLLLGGELLRRLPLPDGLSELSWPGNGD
jgi:hypothetical protein